MLELKGDNFEEAIKEGVTLVDFNADWCGPCQMQAPILEELAEEGEGKYKVAGVNIDAEGELAEKNAVSSIPCLVLFKDGKEVERVVGLRPKKALEKMLLKHSD